MAVPILISANLMPALRFDTWYCGLRVQASAAVATYIRHGDTVKEAHQDIRDSGGNLIDTAPTDGWYTLTGLALKGGIEYSHTLGAHLCCRISTGPVWYPSAYTGMMDAMMIGQIPFYLEAGCSYSF